MRPADYTFCEKCKKHTVILLGDYSGVDCTNPDCNYEQRFPLWKRVILRIKFEYLEVMVVGMFIVLLVIELAPHG